MRDGLQYVALHEVETILRVAGRQKILAHVLDVCIAPIHVIEGNGLAETAFGRHAPIVDIDFGWRRHALERIKQKEIANVSGFQQSQSYRHH